MLIDPFTMALDVAEKLLLSQPRTDRTIERIREAAETAAKPASVIGPVDVDRLVEELESRFDVWVPRPVAVTSPDAHQPWYPERREKISFDYWNRYRTWLASRRSWKPQPVEALDEATDVILDRLEDPERAGPWAFYGLVYGQVQSGKTANYTGTICKAVDAGYHVVIVLAGRHESLRTQTQARLDLEFLGFNTRVTRTRGEGAGLGDIGVGTLGLRHPVQCFPLTTTEADFKKAVAQSTAVDLRKNRVLIVVKKYKSILENLTGWLANFNKDGALADLPLLLIDDEADDASIDTRKTPDKKTHSDPEHDPTAINAAIRDLLGLFDKRAYLAYTATPFGNIFIPHDTDHPEHGPDLFPRHLVLALRPPTNYCGPETVFGLEDATADEVRQPLPIISVVDDHETWMPDKHKGGHRPPARLPASLVNAIEAFVLATAVRKVRAARPGGRPDHNSMLIHVTRFTDIQTAVVNQVRQHLAHMRDTWGDHGAAGAALRRRLSKLWKQDFVPVHLDLAARDNLGDAVGEPVVLKEVQEILPEVLAEAAGNVKAINGTAQDVLEYGSTPVTVVAVGGDKLSRGLTLEGLTVSYYLRASKAYDTLLQMGRWFGYRPGYLDVTRLYTTQELVDYYVHITRANRNLMDVVATVAENGDTPRDVGLKIEDGYGQLQVTAAAKRRSATTLSFTFSGERPETLVMLSDPVTKAANKTVFDRLVENTLNCPELPVERRPRGQRGYFRSEVPAAVVKDFLNDFRASPRNVQATPKVLVEYIEAQESKGELTRWIVAIVAGKADTTDTIDGVELRRITRKNTTNSDPARCREHEVGVLVSPTDEAIGFDAEQLAVAKKRTQALAGDQTTVKRPSGKVLRRMRDPAEGLLVVYRVDPGTNQDDDLLIGFAVPFPRSDNAKRLQYKVNNVFIENLAKSLRAEELGQSEDDLE
ncbi:Z1 domain-containing protein [Micromonospora sp. WMMD1219]|uniref:Z1 domain-containing protein n=1 Tax=Micromonospora sp. WMMD1219 TaxID=3404115 RepID=UPI003BF6131E